MSGPLFSNFRQLIRASHFTDLHYVFTIVVCELTKLANKNNKLARKKSFKLGLQAKRSLLGVRVTLKQSQSRLKQHTVTMSTHQHSPHLFPKILLFRLYKGGQTNRQKPQCLCESARSPMVQQASGCLSCNTRVSVDATLWASSLSGRGDKGPVTAKSSGNRSRRKGSHRDWFRETQIEEFKLHLEG